MSHRRMPAHLPVVLFAMAAFLFLSSAQLFGQGPPRGRRMSLEDQLTNLQKQLNLTDQQVTQVKSILEDRQARLMKMRESRQGMERTEENREAMRSEMDALNKDTEAQLSKVLSEEQMKQYREMRQQRSRRMRGGGPPQGGPGSGGPGGTDR
ncbi:MAG: hypothetical protein WAO20_18425 [Acidobacteriota bacterium]